MNSALLVPVLAYHRLHVGGGPADPSLKAFSMEAGRFREHMEALLSAGYETGSLSDFLAWREGRQPAPEKPILLTFDDGWESNYRWARPALGGLGMKWTIFVVGDPQAGVFQEGDTLDGPLTKEEIRQLAEEGVGLESHGMSHRPMTEIPAEELRRELTESRWRLAALTGGAVEWLAAPYGLADRRVEKAAREAGYRGFFPGGVGASRLGEEPLRLRRIGPPPHWPAEELLERLTPQWLKRTAFRGNIQRRIRLTLGHARSTRLRAFTRGRLGW